MGVELVLGTGGSEGTRWVLHQVRVTVGGITLLGTCVFLIFWPCALNFTYVH